MASEVPWNPGIWAAAGGALPDGWDLVPFETFLESPRAMSVGVMYPGENVADGTPLIRVGDVGDGGVVGSPSMHISAEVHHEYRRTELQGNELLITLVGKPGVCVIARPHMKGWNVARALAVARLKDSEIRPYIKAVLESNTMKNIVLSMLNTTVQPTLNLKEIRSLPVPLPANRSIAIEIGSIAEDFNQRIALIGDTNHSLEKLASALFESWFVRFDPVRAKSEGREPEGMSADIATLFPSEFVDSELGQIPKGWSASTLSEAFEINPSRKLPKGTVASYLDMSSAPTNGHCPSGTIQREVGSGSKFINGDTLLAKITPCLENGKTAHVDFLRDQEVGWGSTEFIVLRPKSPLPVYLGYLLARHEDFRQFAIQAMTGTSGRQRVDVGQLARYPLVVPDAAACSAFDALIDPLRVRISHGVAQAATLASLRDAVLPRLLSRG